jgi:putative heme iron utilization protein
MVGIDVDGFDVRTGARLLRLEFDGPVTDAAATRSALAALAARARGA